MQGDRPQMVFIEVLVNLEQIGLGVVSCSQRLVQWREMSAGNHHDGAVYLVDEADWGLIMIVR